MKDTDRQDIYQAAMRMLDTDSVYWDSLLSPPYNECKTKEHHDIAVRAYKAFEEYRGILDLYGILSDNPRGLALSIVNER